MDHFLELDRGELAPDAEDLARIAAMREAAAEGPAAPPEPAGPSVRGRPFVKGESGNPDGKRPGTRNRKTVLMELLSDGDIRGLKEKAVEIGHAGNALVLRAWIEKLVPACRERFVEFELPPIETPADLAPAMGAVMAALAGGEITPGEAERITNSALRWMHAIEIGDLAVQLQELRREVK